MGQTSALPQELEVLSDDAQTKVKQTDEMLDAVGSAVSDLKFMASRMGNEVTHTHPMLSLLLYSLEPE